MLKGAAIYPPGPKRRLPGAMLFAFRRDPLGTTVNITREYGDLAHYRIGGFHVYQASNPALIRDVLVVNNSKFIKSRGLQVAKRILGNGLLTSEGEFHSRQRRLIQPAFLHERISSYAKLMTEYAERQTSNWQDGQRLDIHEEMMRLTLAIVAKTLFDADVEREAKEIGEAMSTALEYFRRFLSPVAPLLDVLPLPSNKRFERARRRLDGIIYGIIEERRKSGKNPDDLLQMLLHARNDDASVMTDEQLRDEALTLFLAGHETTANALTWTWYLLSQNSAKEERLHEELDSVLKGGSPTVSDVPSLRYTSMVLSESMRLYPPAWILGRQAIEDCKVGDYLVRKDSIVLMSQYVMHHHPRYFDSPEEFKPERWTDEMKAKLPKFVYFPFGGGPRSCVGEPFAWIEGILLIASIARRWRLTHEVPHRVEMLPRITLRPKYGMMMIVGKR